MCGRYTLLKLNELLAHFPWLQMPPGVEPRYNIAPTQPILAVANEKPNQLDYYHWGLIPRWAKDQSIAGKMINARAESLAEKPAFRDSFLGRRCLIPADGFYEWRLEADGRKTPMYIRLRGGEPFFFAGLWDTWQDPQGSQLPSCTIITTKPNTLVDSIHNRMPAILQRRHIERWLDPNEREPEKLLEMLGPYPAEEMEAHPVPSLVNSAKNELPECIEPVESETLF